NLDDIAADIAFVHFRNHCHDFVSPFLCVSLVLLVVFDHLLRKLFSELEAALFIFGRRPVKDLQSWFHRIKGHSLEVIVDLFYGPAAPAIASERADKTVLGAKPAKMGQELRDSRKCYIVQGRRADKRTSRLPELLDRNAHRGGAKLDDIYSHPL